MPEGSSKTFFSYAREDSEFVLRLVKDLRAAGADVWLDQLDIGPGEHWDAAIEKALRQCPSHLTVLSPDSVDSENVMDEVSYALEEHKQVIPLLYRECPIPFRLRRVQYIDFRTGYAAGLRDLLKALGVITQPAAPATPERVVSTPATAEQSGSAVGPPAQPALKVEPQSRERELTDGRAPTADQLKPREPEFIAARALVPEQPKPRQLEGRKKLWLAVGGIVLLVLVIILWRTAATHGAKEQAGGAKPMESPTPAAVGNDQPEKPAGASQPSAVEGSGDADSSTAQTGKDLPSNSKDARLSYQRGKGYLDNQQYDQAIEAFTQAIRLDPDYAEAYNSRGVAYRRSKRYEQAIQDYDQALKLTPNYAEAYNNRGFAYYSNGEYNQAIQDYNSALKLNPNYAKTYANRANAYSGKNEYDRAIQDYDQFLKNHTDAPTFYNRGNAYLNKKEYDRAIQDYNQALKLNPNYAHAYGGRGLAYKNKGEYDRAVQEYNQALKLDPNDRSAYGNRGLAYSSKGEYDRAIQDYNQVLKLNPNDPKAYANRGIAYSRKGEYDRAIQDYNQVLKLNPNDAISYNNRGVAYEKKGQYRQALQDFDQALRLNANYALARKNRDRLAAKSKKK